MSKSGTKEALFQEIAIAHFQGKEVTVDEMRAICEANGFWGDDEDAQLLRDAKNKVMRTLARKPIYDESGNRLEMFNIVRPAAEDPTTGEPVPKQQFFRFAHEVDKDDFEYVIRQNVKRRDYFTREITRQLGMYGERFGKKSRTLFQRRLNLDFDIP